MDLYGSIIRHALFPLWENHVRRRPTLAHYDSLRASERASLAELRAMQGSALHDLIRHVHARTPYYRRILEQRQLQPDDLRRPEDLEKLPVLSHAQARASRAERTAHGGPPVVITKGTGGSTGEPLVFGYDAGSEHWRVATRLRGYGWAGYQIGDVVMHYWGYPTLTRTRLEAIKQRLDRTLKREHYVDCNFRSDADHRRTLEVLRRLRPRVLVTYAQAGAQLARFVNRTGARTWDDLIVICAAEKLFPADREDLVRAFGPAVFETYGCREVMLIATECASHDGLHESMENLIVEVVDDEGRAVEPGQIGRVLLTDLHNYAQPFIRYEVGDRAEVHPAGAPCGCGRAHRRLGGIQGRIADTLRDGQGNAVDGILFSRIFSAMSGEVEQFQAVQHLDRSITLKLVAARPLTDTMRSHIHDCCRRNLPGVRVTIAQVDEIPLTRNGKRRIVVVEASEPATPAAP